VHNAATFTVVNRVGYESERQVDAVFYTEWLDNTVYVYIVKDVQVEKNVSKKGHLNPLLT